jgi:transcription initiation factor TFIIH subunit 2
MIRYVFLCVDMSRAMSELDMRPSRLAVVTSAVKEFVGHYFEQNPLSQLGIIVTRDGQAIKLTDLSGNPKVRSYFMLLSAPSCPPHEKCATLPFFGG